MMSLDRYALMGTASSLEVEAVPRRPLVAPGTKALTKEQAADRRKARVAYDHRRQLTEALTQRGWVLVHGKGSTYWSHISGAKLPDLELGDRTVDSVLSVANECVRAVEALTRIDLRATLASRGWRDHELLGGNILRHEPTGAVITRHELEQHTPENVLVLADSRIAAVLQRQARATMRAPSYLELKGGPEVGLGLQGLLQPGQYAYMHHHPQQLVGVQVAPASSCGTYTIYPGRGG